MKYRPDIDGLRAIAVMSVLFYHAHLGFPGGYVGVDVFFVISGFLITSLLVRSMTSGTFSYVDFWERRVRRLVPALAAVTLFTAITSYFLLLPEDLVDLGKALIAQPLLLVNVYYWRAVQGGYFSDPPEIRPMLHTWSLGVEEQFYVVFPILLAAIYRRRFLAPHVGKVFAVATLMSLALGIALTPSKGVFAFFMLPTRAWELGLGGCLVFLPTVTLAPPLRDALACLGLAMVGGATIGFNGTTPFPGYAALLPCLGTALVIFSNSQGPATLVGRGLSHPWMVRVGQLSYSLYLWHWPLMAYGDYAGLMRSVESRCLVLFVSGWLGYLSWRWIETPLRGHGILKSRAAVFGFFAVYAGMSVALGGTYLASHGFPANWSQEALKLKAGEKERSFDYEADLDKPDRDLPTLGDKSAPKKSFLLWGDSHAMSMAPVLDDLGRDYGVAGLQLTRSSKAALLAWGCVPTSRKATVSQEFKEQWGATALRLAEQDKLQTVFLVAHWELYDTLEFSQGVEATLSEFAKRKVKVVFVQDVPTQSFEVPRALALATKWPSSLPEVASASGHSQKNHHVQQALTRLSGRAGFFSVDPAPLVFSWKSLAFDGLALYMDKDHLTDHGARQLRPLFEPFFAEMAKRYP